MSRRLARILCLVLFAAVPLSAQETSSLAVSAGSFNFSKDNKAVELGIEMRFPGRRWQLAPMFGVSGTDEGSYWLYGGLRRAFALSAKVSLTPGFAIALYEEGSGKDLGGLVEFRSSIELARSFGKGVEVGFTLHHLSNAGIYDFNPGSNSALLTVAWGIGG